MTSALQSLASWAISHWPGLLVPIVLLGGCLLVRSATVWANWRTRR